MITRLSLIHAMSPLHAGTGQAVGTIDLPIARERPTGIPLLPGSSLKGALRARGTDPDLTRAVFGPETEKASEHSGAVQFSDVHVVLLPVRSVAGTYAWATSRYLLQRLARSAREAGLELPELPPAPGAASCRVAGSQLLVRLGASPKVVLEDLDFAASSEPADGSGPLGAWAGEAGRHLFPDGSLDSAYWRESLRARLCLVDDDSMAYLLDSATEVVARIRLDESTKTVARGALWYEESLPAETVLAGLVVASDVKANGRPAREAKDLLDYVAGLAGGSLVQLGGKASVGHGSCIVRLAGGAA